MRLLLGLLIIALLSGCSDPGSGDDEPEFDESSYTVLVEDFPTAPQMPGEEFTFNVTVSGAQTAQSDHIGAHYGMESSQAPSTTEYPTACPHQSGELPGTFQVTCPAPLESGVYYLRGHARIGAVPEEQVSWWSAEMPFTVAGPV
jgi:hypothetical protein